MTQLLYFLVYFMHYLYLKDKSRGSKESRLLLPCVRL